MKEIRVSADESMPKGYGLLPKGIPYKTLHCRRLTHAAGKTLYVVIDAQKRQLGLRAPRYILREVHQKAKETLSARRAAVRKRDQSVIKTAAGELENQFPKLPKEEKLLILEHGFRKYSGRVGRTGTIPLPRKALLAVIAHVRHKHTKYDALLANGAKKVWARQAINKKIESILRDWGYAGDW